MARDPKFPHQDRICSKCRVFPATNKHPWCLECKAENQAANRAAKDVLARTKGFYEGVEAMRRTLADEFARLGPPTVTCNEVSGMIRNAPRPTFKPDVVYINS